MIRISLLPGLLLGLASCMGSGVPQPATGTITVIGAAMQREAPALAISGGQLASAWIGSDGADVFQVARLNDSEPVVLPLPPRHPYQQTLLASAGGRFHLLWLDSSDTAETRLYSALLGPDLTVERGPVEVSDINTFDYSAVSLPDGTATVAWTGGSPAGPGLFLQQIDLSGRARAVFASARNATQPALSSLSDGTVFAFYESEGDLLRARVFGESLLDTVRLNRTPAIGPTDRLHPVFAATNGTCGYVFWNISHADGAAETWWTSGTLDASSWRAPQRLVPIDGGMPLRWMRPASGEEELLEAAVLQGDTLSLARLSCESLLGTVPLVAEQELLSAPSILREDSGLTIGWSLPGDNQPARLLLLHVSREDISMR